VICQWVSVCEWVWPATTGVEMASFIYVRAVQMHCMNWWEAVGRQTALIGRVSPTLFTCLTDWYVHLNCFVNLPSLGKLLLRTQLWWLRNQSSLTALPQLWLFLLHLNEPFLPFTYILGATGTTLGLFLGPWPPNGHAL